MTLLVAALLGGGYVAYRAGTAPPPGEAASAPVGGENQPGAGGAAPATPTQQTSNQPTGSGNAAASTNGTAAASNRGDQQPGKGSVSEANSVSSSAPSSNQATGIVSGGEAQAQAGSVVGVAAHGKVLFNANCQGCHGANAKGVVGPSLVEPGGPADWQFADFRRTLLKGVTPDGKTLNTTMPRFGVTPLQPKGQPASDQDLADIQAYLKTLQ